MDLGLALREENYDIKSFEYGLRTAITISLFTDKRVFENELPQGEEKLRGWWGDEFLESQIGSKLWTLNRNKIDRSTKVLAEQYAEQALEWLIEDKIAKAVNVVALFEDDDITLEVDISFSGRSSINQKFKKIINSERERNNDGL